MVVPQQDSIGQDSRHSLIGHSLIGQTSIGHRLLRSILRRLIGRDNQQFYEAIDWQQERERVQQPLTYPDYYTSPNFHGIEQGYLNPIAAITYDAVTALASPPQEMWVRQHLMAAIQGQPQRILDLGCGTGTATLMLKQAFPTAVVTGLDLSPYMLVVAAEKARKAGMAIEWRHGLAESTEFEAGQFDLVTASFLFHETPPQVALLILQECFRLLKPGGQVLILDGNQHILRHADWLIRLFQEPYSRVYAAGDTQAWMKSVGFQSTEAIGFGWIHQLNSGVK
ncbi:class I SAM-dependent methyltransferase [Egbenema bharatensis]|uniref:class I SAM-dependent methyltransferase n=1 Tax=Egbenema bharatensis TaxID=3463334 RepID=UPI003A872EA6